MRNQVSYGLIGLSVSGAVSALILGAGPSAYANAPKPPPGTVLRLTFDNGESLARNTIVRDVSGHHHAGRVVTQVGGHLRRGPGKFKRGAIYPARCHGCGRAIIDVKNARGLNPDKRSFVFGASVRVTPHQSKRGSNVVQKGFFNQAGGQYKLELDAGGIPRCVVRGHLGRLIVTAPKAIDDARWHTLSCTRTATFVRLRVDRRIAATVRGSTGFLSNVADVHVGGKKINPRNKQFHGHLNTVFVRRLTPPTR